MTDRLPFTAPLTVGAPLPTDLDGLPPVEPQQIRNELQRAAVELVYAIARHRKAWSLMRKRAEVRDGLAGQPGALAALESDPIWKKRTGDVQWWRAEMEARAAVVLALKALL